MTSDEEIRLECLKLALTGTPSQTIRNAQEYYDFVTVKGSQIKPNEVAEDSATDPPKRRGRPPKK